jgi:hypothetical protein
MPFPGVHKGNGLTPWSRFKISIELSSSRTQIQVCPDFLSEVLTMIEEPAIPPALPDTPMGNILRTVNVMTALSGLVVSVVLGMVLLLTGVTLTLTLIGAPAGIAMLALLPLLCRGCGSYGAAFTRYEKSPLPWLFFQTLVMIAALGISIARNSKAPDIPWSAGWWELIPALLSWAMIFLSMVAAVTHVLSLTGLLYFGQKSSWRRQDSH